MEAAGAVDAQNAPTAPWNIPQGFELRHSSCPLLLVEQFPRFLSETIIAYVAGHRPVVDPLWLVRRHPGPSNQNRLS